MEACGLNVAPILYRTQPNPPQSPGVHFQTVLMAEHRSSPPPNAPLKWTSTPPPSILPPLNRLVTLKWRCSQFSGSGGVGCGGWAWSDRACPCERAKEDGQGHYSLIRPWWSAAALSPLAAKPPRAASTISHLHLTIYPSDKRLSPASDAPWGALVSEREGPTVSFKGFAVQRFAAVVTLRLGSIFSLPVFPKIMIRLLQPIN